MYIRILVFYIGGVTIIGLLVPSTDPGLALDSGTAAASPFVIAIKRSGIKSLPGVRYVSFALHLPNLKLNGRLIAAAHKRVPSDIRLVRSIK